MHYLLNFIASNTGRALPLKSKIVELAVTLSATFQMSPTFVKTTYEINKLTN